MHFPRPPHPRPPPPIKKKRSAACQTVNPLYRYVCSFSADWSVVCGPFKEGWHCILAILSVCCLVSTSQQWSKKWWKKTTSWVHVPTTAVVTFVLHWLCLADPSTWVSVFSLAVCLTTSNVKKKKYIYIYIYKHICFQKKTTTQKIL